MSRAKLERLGLRLPLLPTSTVGSFPKPGYLVEARAKRTRPGGSPQSAERRRFDAWQADYDRLVGTAEDVT